MKKYLLSIAALLLGLLAHSQEADELGNYAELSVVARLDANPYFGNEPEFTLGNSSIYTLFTGSASEHFSWALQNHWFSGNSFLGPEADPFDQFKGLGYSDNTNFLDLANRIAVKVKSVIGFTPLVKVVENGLLPRSEKKTKRVIDERYD